MNRDNSGYNGDGVDMYIAEWCTVKDDWDHGIKHCTLLATAAGQSIHTNKYHTHKHNL